VFCAGRAGVDHDRWIASWGGIALRPKAIILVACRGVEFLQGLVALVPSWVQGIENLAVGLPGLGFEQVVQCGYEVGMKSGAGH